MSCASCHKNINWNDMSIWRGFDLCSVIDCRPSRAFTTSCPTSAKLNYSPYPDKDVAFKSDIVSLTPQHFSLHCKHINTQMDISLKSIKCNFFFFPSDLMRYSAATYAVIHPKQLRYYIVLLQNSYLYLSAWLYRK